MIYVTLAIFGLALGSFVNALVWRLHEQDEQVGKKHSEKQEQYVRDLSVTKGRSMCPYCQHQLAAKDLIPVLSYVSLGGKCRYCHHKIDDTPFSEIVTALLFILSYIYWPLDFHGVGTIEFVFWLIFLTGFMALAMYDLKWFLLPNRIVYPLLVLAVVQTLIVTLFYRGGWSFTEDAFLAALIGGGLFYLLFQISGGKWIGGGDVKLG
jgi:prepilin signal peptidase PulO-like enzyme (type II secretory pathway)